MSFARIVAPALFLVSAAAVAQGHSMPACAGSYNILRTSQIKPGQLELFLKAVNDQRAWYKTAGTQDEILLFRVIDPATGDYSTTEAITAHRTPTGQPRQKTDAAFEAFVKEFGDSSTITKQCTTCETK